MSQTLSRVQDDPVFTEIDAALLVVDRDFVIRAANPAYLRATSRSREELLGTGLFDAFPDNPADPEADGVANLSASLETVFSRGRCDRMAVQRYDIRAADPRHGFVRKFWSPVNSPIHDERGRTAGAVHRVDDVTEVVGPIVEGAEPPHRADHHGWTRLVSTLAAEMLAHRQTRATVAQLRGALSSRVLIEQAKGVLAAQRRCTPDEAFELLRGWSRSTSTPIRTVAGSVVSRATGPGTGPALEP